MGRMRRAIYYLTLTEIGIKCFRTFAPKPIALIKSFFPEYRLNIFRSYMSITKLG